MGLDVFQLLYSTIVFLIYGSVCIISIIFTFSLDTYLELCDILNFDVFASPILTPIEKSVDWFDEWGIRNHTVLGPIFIVLSLIDLRLFFDLINTF